MRIFHEGREKKEMNTPETIDIKKYANALNELIGIDSAYMAGDKSVDAIVEVIVAAKKLEKKVKELTEQLEQEQSWANSMIDNLRDDIKELTEENKRLKFYESGYTLVNQAYEELKTDIVRKMQEKLREYFSYNSIALYREFTIREIVDQIAKEMLEDTE
jgi:F0F1-type ATP synthase membrane subunit b/b'